MILVKSLLIPICSVLLIFLSTVSQASSQMMPPGMQQAPNINSTIPLNTSGLQPSQMPKQVSGNYSNSEFGLELMFPDDITGMEASASPSSTTINAQIPTQPSSTTDHVLMTIIMTDLSKMGLTTPVGDSCLNPSVATVNIGGKNVQIRDEPCGFSQYVGIPLKAKSYFADLGKGKAIEFILYLNQPSPDLALKIFEQIVKSVKFTK